MKRTEDIHIRVTPEEKSELAKKAAAAGITITALVISFLGSEKLGENLGDSINSFRKRRSK